jgi:hypothetical protein
LSYATVVAAVSCEGLTSASEQRSRRINNFSARRAGDASVADFRIEFARSVADRSHDAKPEID